MANVLEVNVCVRRALAESFVKAFCVLETAQTMVFVSMVNASVSPIILARIAADWCQHYLVASVQIMEILTIQVNLAFAIKVLIYFRLKNHTSLVPKRTRFYTYFLFSNIK
jgi:hypothetical protein